MKQVITGEDEVFGPWMMGKLGRPWVAGHGHTIGLWDIELDRPVASVYYESWNGASILLHCVGEGKKWLNREFLWFVFHYAFVDLEVRKILSPVESDNTDSKRFIQSIGFSLEATLQDASPKGNLLIYSMRSSACKWLDLRDRYRGQTQSTSST